MHACWRHYPRPQREGSTAAKPSTPLASRPTPDAVLLGAGGVLGQNAWIVVAWTAVQEGGRGRGRWNLCGASSRRGMGLSFRRLPRSFRLARRSSHPSFCWQRLSEDLPHSHPPAQVCVPLVQGTSLPEYMRPLLDQFLPATSAPKSGPRQHHELAEVCIMCIQMPQSAIARSRHHSSPMPGWLRGM